VISGQHSQIGIRRLTVAENFFKKYPKVATCPLTELALVRVWMQKGASGVDADKALKDFISKYRSRLIADDLSATAIAGLNQGHEVVLMILPGKGHQQIRVGQNHGKSSSNLCTSPVVMASPTKTSR
jgi:hypothetical protein